VTGTVRTALGVVVRDWGGELAVVHSRRSNSTHLISAEAASVLRSASGKPISAADLPHDGEVIAALLRCGLLVEAP
jgi:hypothetical protein